MNKKSFYLFSHPQKDCLEMVSSKYWHFFLLDAFVATTPE